MNLTLHLTAECNLRCSYCYEAHCANRMTWDTARRAVDLVFSYGHKNNGLSLFGGEPLLERDLAEKICRYAKAAARSMGVDVRFKMTTNGTLLDEDFLRFADEHSVEIALSHDGLLQDAMRLTRDGHPTRERLEPVIDALLQFQPGAAALQTVTPGTVGGMADSVRWLYDRGFTRINTVIDYRPGAGWDDRSLVVLKEQYKAVSGLMETYFEEKRPLLFLPFLTKISAYLNSRPCLECKLGMRQPSVAEDGSIYPCNQFLHNEQYRMGDVFSGIDREKQRSIYTASLAPEPDCEGCAISDRCRHHCACLNFSLTGSMQQVAPVQCEHERILIPIADELAASLYAKKSARFLLNYREEALE